MGTRPGLARATGLLPAPHLSSDRRHTPGSTHLASSPPPPSGKRNSYPPPIALPDAHCPAHLAAARRKLVRGTQDPKDPQDPREASSHSSLMRLRGLLSSLH